MIERGSDTPSPLSHREICQSIAADILRRDPTTIIRPHQTTFMEIALPQNDESGGDTRMTGSLIIYRNGNNRLHFLRVPWTNNRLPG